MKSCSSPPLRLGRPLWSILLFPRGRFMDASLHHAESGFQDSHEPLWAMSPQGGRERYGAWQALQRKGLRAESRSRPGF